MLGTPQKRQVFEDEAARGTARGKVWQVGATCGQVTALMDHLRTEGIQRLVLESTSD